jgi:site-specific DNA-methyltransferase (cytosine-N4-specific)
MQKMLRRGSYNAGDRPSEWVISDDAWTKDHGGAIPPNVIETLDRDLSRDEIRAAAERLGAPITSAAEPDNMLDFGNTNSSEPYHVFCRHNDLHRHPARFPRRLPEFFVDFLTEPGDLVLDPFGGSNVTGEVAEAHSRRWKSVELNYEYIVGSLGRFDHAAVRIRDAALKKMAETLEYPPYES